MTAPLEVDAITRAIVDSELRYAFTDRLDITRITRRQSLDSYLDLGARPDISQSVESRCEDMRL